LCALGWVGGVSVIGEELSTAQGVGRGQIGMRKINMRVGRRATGRGAGSIKGILARQVKKSRNWGERNKLAKTRARQHSGGGVNKYRRNANDVCGGRC